MQIFQEQELETAPLIVDAIYRGARRGNAGDDPFPVLLRLSNSGGFRYRGTVADLKMVALTTSMNDPDWPDNLDHETGVYTYFGDNKRAGRPLHSTPRKGNELLRVIFENAHLGEAGRAKVPPVLVFASTGEWRDVVFLGLAVPGTSDLAAAEDLVAIWRSSGGTRFQNYRARFTILNEPTIGRAWINDLIKGIYDTDQAPPAWKSWVKTGRARALQAPRSVEHRTKNEQLPADAAGKAMIAELHRHFAGRPHSFERCAALLVKAMLPDIAEMDLTRPSRDGGRDAVGRLRIGAGAASILVEFALEAKCYGLGNSVGVREMARLISRLRHRQFGIIVTTSWVDLQAYREIKEDGHPIIVVSAADLVDLLIRSGTPALTDLRTWLSREFPPNAPDVAVAPITQPSVALP